MPRTVRTFVAVEITDEIRRRACDLISRLGVSSANVKWVAAKNLHLTLKFLGEVNLTDVSNICRAMSKATRPLRPFQTEVFGAGAFPKADKPRTIWLGVRGGENDMVRLHDAIDLALAPLGFRQEHRRFRPHMTIGRVRGGGPGIAELGELVAKNQSFEAGSMTTAGVVVFSSMLESSGPIYEVLGRSPLSGHAES